MVEAVHAQISKEEFAIVERDSLDLGVGSVVPREEAGQWSVMLSSITGPVNSPLVETVHDWCHDLNGEVPNHGAHREDHGA